MLHGAFTHQDFSGHKGTIRTGDVQWMTAGRGIVHSEMPASDGVQKGLQLWINLASKDKMIEPRYQELESKDISQAEKDGVAVRIIAGEAFGVRSPVYTHGRQPCTWTSQCNQGRSSTSQSQRAGMPSCTSSRGRACSARRARRRRARTTASCSAQGTGSACGIGPAHRCRAVAQRASGAAGALRHELACPDPAGHGGLLLRPRRLREGQPVELRLILIGVPP